MTPAKSKTATWPPRASASWPREEQDLLARLNPETLPRHVAIIMDGNGRWAKQRGFMDRIRGHEAGIEAVREAARTSAELGLEAITLYSFSKENWQRPRREVAALMRLLERFAVEERDELMENDMKLSTIGGIEDLSDSVRRELAETERLTRDNRGTRLVLALSYGGRDEIVRAMRHAAKEAASGKLKPEDIDEARISAWLDTSDLPDPDLLVRTSGELRVSNFLLWQIAYTEIYVTQVLWPDFRRRHYLEALVDYARRDRRFGGINNSRAGASGPA